MRGGLNKSTSLVALMAAAGILAGLRFDESLAHSLFRKELMMQSVIYREILAEGELIGEKRGKQEGERHGRLTLIRRMLNRRFAFLPKHVKTGVAKLSASQLDRLGEALLDFHSVDEITDWLDSQHS